MPLNNEIPSYESLLEFQEVYLRAIALSWRDEGFKHSLLEDPARAMEMYFGYKLPWTLKLKVRSPDAQEALWDAKEMKWQLPLNSMSFGVPSAPDFEEQAVALATYNDAGPTYLFTCC
jgi:ribosomally synthesized peptide (two-chain TOMM family)